MSSKRWKGDECCTYMRALKVFEVRGDRRSWREKRDGDEDENDTTGDGGDERKQLTPATEEENQVTKSHGHRITAVISLFPLHCIVTTAEYYWDRNFVSLFWKFRFSVFGNKAATTTTSIKCFIYLFISLKFLLLSSSRVLYCQYLLSFVSLRQQQQKQSKFSTLNQSRENVGGFSSPVAAK